MPGVYFFKGVVKHFPESNFTMSFLFQSVCFHELKFTGKWSIHPWETEFYSNELKNSIIQTGVIHPPFLLQHSDKKFEVVAGYKRLLIANQYLESDKLGCFILPEDFPKLYILDLLLTDQSNTAPLSLVEKARFIQIAAEYLTDEEIIEQFSARLELKKQNSTIDESLAILNLHSDIVKEIHSGRLQNKMITELLRLKHPEDRLTLVSLFKKLCLGTGKQKKLFSLIRDLAYRNHTSMSDFLNDDEIQKILTHNEMNSPQKAQHLGNLLQKQLTPAYQEVETSFNAFLKKLELPKNLALSHSQAFETDEVTLSINCKNLQECRQLLPEIKNVLKNRK